MLRYATLRYCTILDVSGLSIVSVASLCLPSLTNHPPTNVEDLKGLSKKGRDATLRSTPDDTSASSHTNDTSNEDKRRYLILTYSGEFDRVHYPLPIDFEETPDAEAMARTISWLRKELEIAQQQQKSEFPDPPPNTSSKNANSSTPPHPHPPKSKKKTDPPPSLGDGKNFTKGEFYNLKRENASLKKEIASINDAYIALEEESSKETKKLMREINALDNRAALRAGVGITRSDSANGARERDVRRRLHATETELEKKKEEIRKLQTKHKKDIQRLETKSNRQNKEISVLRSRLRNHTGGSISSVPSSPMSTITDPSPFRSNTRRTTKSRTATPTTTKTKSSVKSSKILHSRGRSMSSERRGNTENFRRPPPPRSVSPRFDPTAYVNNQKEKRRQNELNRGFRGSSGYTSSDSDASSRSSSSLRRRRNNTSLRAASPPAIKRETASASAKPLSSSPSPSPAAAAAKARKIVTERRIRPKTAPNHPLSRKATSTRNNTEQIAKAVDIATDNSSPVNFEISEIDRRLNALQGFLKDAKKKKIAEPQAGHE